MVRGTGDVYYQRTPDHQQPYRKSPVFLQDILLESNLRDGLHLVDRTDYSTSDVMYIAEQMDIVGQSGYVDRKECTSS